MKEDWLGLATLQTGVTSKRKYTLLCVSLCYLPQLPNTRVVLLLKESMHCLVGITPCYLLLHKSGGSIHGGSVSR